MKRRVLSLIMAFVLCFTMLPTSALAQEVKTPAASAPVAETKDAPKVADPTTAPTAAGTAPTVAGTTPTVAVTAPTEVSVPATEDGALAAEGEVAPQSDEGIAIQSGEYVAEVDGIQYDTLEEALDHVDEGEITLLDNISVEVLEIYGATINMNGHSITSAIEAYDSLTLKDGTVNGTVKVDGGTFTLTAAGAEVAINGELNVISGSCSVTGAKIGVKGTLYFDGTDMLITGTDKAVDLDKAAEPAHKTFYGSTDVGGDTTEEATFDTDTYKVGGEVARKLTNKQESVTPPAQTSLTLSPETANVNAGETATFAVIYNGTDDLDADMQISALNENFDVRLNQAEDGTYTIAVKVDAETPGGDYTLHVHEVENAFVQAKATIHVTALTPVAEVNGKQYALLNNAFAAAGEGDTVTMLANHVTDEDAVIAGDESTLAVVTKKLTLDLNGCTVDHLEVGGQTLDAETETITYSPGNLTIVDNGSGGTAGKIIDLELVKGTLLLQSGQLGDNGSSISEGITGGLICDGDSGDVTISGGTVLGLTVGKGASVVVSGGSQHVGSWFNDGTLSITGGTFGSVNFFYRAGTIAISGGTFDVITNHDASTTIPPMSLLAKGHAFYDRNDGTTLKDGSMRDYLRDVTVKEHTHAIENGKCDCGLAAVIRDSNDDFYNTLQDALNAAAKDDSIEWVQLEQDLTEQVTFDAAGASVTVRMNGKTLTAPNNEAPALTVSGGTLTITGDAKIVNPYVGVIGAIESTQPAILLTGGKLIFEGDLTAEGGYFGNTSNYYRRTFAVKATGGELGFRGGLNLKGGLAVLETATLANKLTQGKFWVDTANKETSPYGVVAVTAESISDLNKTYSTVRYLLADGYAFADDAGKVVDAARAGLHGNSTNAYITIVTHTHEFHAVTGRSFWMCDCGENCFHESMVNGICTVCGYACPHNNVNEETYECADCHTTMTAKVVDPDGSTAYYADGTYEGGNSRSGLDLAFASAPTGSTVTVLGGKFVTAYLDGGKALTLELNEKPVENLYIGRGGNSA